MSFNEFILPALPQAPVAGLNGSDKTASAAFKSCRHDESTDQDRSFLATLNQISNAKCERSRESTAVKNVDGVSDNMDTESMSPGNMNQPNDTPHAGLGDTEGPESASAAACAHPWQALGFIHQQFFNFLMSANASTASADHSDATSGAKPFVFSNLIAQLQTEGHAVQNGQVGIGIFEQLQVNIAPEATHLYFFEQIAAGAHYHHNGDVAMSGPGQFWGFENWMATLSAGNPSAQTGALGPNTNSALYSLLNLQSVGSPELGLVAQNGGAGEQNSTANPATIDLSAEFLYKMSAQSQASGSDNAENTQATFPVNAKNGSLFTLAAGIQDSEIPADSKLQHATKNAQLHRFQAADRSSDQTVNSKLAAEVAVGKPAEEGFNAKGAVLKNQMPLAAEVVDRVVQIEGETKDSSLLHGQDHMSERLAKFETSKSASTQGSFSSQALNQIVQKAVLSFNNGQNEVRIDLKPEFLGHIRMQIVTDSQQVAVKIVAESAFVKDMLESNLNQLKADLQAQGLKVDELEVSVARDSNSNAKDQTTAEASKSGDSRDDTDAEEGNSEEPDESPADGRETMAENAIDYFA